MISMLYDTPVRAPVLLTCSKSHSISHPHITSVQYCGGCSIHWRFTVHRSNISTVGDSFSAVEVTQYNEGIASVLWRLFSTVGDNIQYSFITVGVFSTFGDNISTCGGNISTVEDRISTLEDTFSTVRDIFSTVGITSVLWRLLSALEITIWNIRNFQTTLEIFSRPYFASKWDRPHYSHQLLTTADMVKDLGYKNLVLGKILLWTYERLGFSGNILWNFLATVAEFVSSLWCKANPDLQQFYVVCSIYSEWTRMWLVFKVSNGSS